MTHSGQRLPVPEVRAGPDEGHPAPVLGAGELLQQSRRLGRLGVRVPGTDRESDAPDTSLTTTPVALAHLLAGTRTGLVPQRTTSKTFF